MKRLLLLAVLLLAACSDQEAGTETEVEASNLSMDTFISAYESEGIAVDTEAKPAFGMIGASDGIIFRTENGPIKIYEYHSKEAIETASENFPMINDWDKNGLFVLESSQDQAKEIFNSVE
jgi:hypothetical protein